jgi:glycerol-3-phosphate acyltransferase PlsY
MPWVLIIWGIIIFLFCYLIGSIPFSYIVASFYGKNLYKVGSGNVGTANVWRATKKIEATALALIGDVGKGTLSLYIAESLSKGCFVPFLWIAYSIAAFSAVLGHNWPIYLKFKGGRGLATLAGSLIYLDWRVLILALITIGFFIYLVEFLTKRGKIKLEGNLKEKIRTLFTILISQVLGRMIGIFIALIVIFFLFPQVFKIAIPAVILAGVKHIKRTKTFLAGKRV